MILDGPSNTTAFAGNPVTFRCRFNGTQDLPQWDIGRTVYSSSTLPPGFHYSIIQQGLYIPSVWESLNHTMIRCLFVVHVGGGSLSRIESAPAYLVVYSCHNGRNNSDNQPSASNTPMNIDLSDNTVNVTSTNCTMEIAQCRKSVSTEALMSREVCKFHCMYIPTVTT